MTLPGVGPNNREMINKVIKGIRVANEAFHKLSIDSEEKFKLSKLMEFPHLKELFKDLVDSGKMKEEDFWK
jgi:hypothetical protein